jgi:hypothetical protein
MPTNFWTLPTLSLHDAISTHHHEIPALTGSEFQGWKCSAYINCDTTQSFLHDRVCTNINTACKLIT